MAPLPLSLLSDLGTLSVWEGNGKDPAPSSLTHNTAQGSDLTTGIWGFTLTPHSSQEETEAQGAWVTCLRANHQKTKQDQIDLSQMWRLSLDHTGDSLCLQAGLLISNAWQS